MFKKRDRNTKELKRTVEDRYQEEEQNQSNKDEKVSQQNQKRLKTEHIHSHNHGHCCNHDHEHNHGHQEEKIKPNSVIQNIKKKVNVVSTKDHKNVTKNFISTEVNGLEEKEIEKREHTVHFDGAKQIDIDDYELDELALAKKNIEITQGILEGKLNPNVYRGEHGYQNYFNQTEVDLKQKQFTGKLGSIRAPTFIRRTTRVDYNPELCKDYYETGKCGFGDSCIFIHDRGDYKPGWLLDQEYEKELKKKELRELGVDVGEDEEENYEIHSEASQGEVDSDGLPIVCRICEQIFTNPIVTTCNHYFCEKCALQHYAESSNCYICQKPTNGIFNEAHKLQQKSIKLKKKQQEYAEDNEQDHYEDSDNENIQAEKTTITHQKLSHPHDSSEEDNGVIDKSDKEVFKEYQQKFKDIDKKKYESQTGWFIP